MRRVALFDFDGTLCPGDSIVPFLRFCVREGLAPRRQWLRAGKGYLNQLLHPERVRSAKAATLSFLRGKSREEMEAAADRFIREKLAPRFYTEGIRTLEKLRAEGVQILLISASADVYMNRMPHFLPVDEVLATLCLKGPDGRYSGEIGENCRGEEKIRRFRAWQAAQPEETEVLWACGDSAHDRPMLSLAERPVLVNTTEKLAASVPGVSVVHWKKRDAHAGD